MNTVDKYQGRDKDCIIISFVRSNTKKNVRSVTISFESLFSLYVEV